MTTGIGQLRGDGIIPVAGIARIRNAYSIGKVGDDGFGKIERDYRQAIETLTTKRLKLAGQLCVAWVVPMGLLYAAGGLIGWIKQGKS